MPRDLLSTGCSSCQASTGSNSESGVARRPLKSEFPTRAQIEAEQLEQLRALLTELFPANPFYSKKLQAKGITFDVASLEDFSRRFPFTTKSEIVQDQLANPPFGTNLTYPLANYTRYHQTSGTTG